MIPWGVQGFYFTPVLQTSVIPPTEVRNSHGLHIHS